MPSLNCSSFSIIILWWFLFVFLIKQPVYGCMAGGGQNVICCPPFSSIGCAPSIPICGGSNSFGSNYEAPQSIFYPRPFSTYQINNNNKVKCVYDNIIEEMEFQKVDIDENNKIGCGQQGPPCPSENLNNLPLSISDENIPLCIDGCLNENNLQINNNNLKLPLNQNIYFLSSPLPFATQLTELPIIAPQDLFDRQNDYDNLDNNNENEIIISSTISSLLFTQTTFSYELFPSSVEVSPSLLNIEEILQQNSLSTTTNINELIITNNNNNNILLDITTTISTLISNFITTKIIEIKTNSNSLINYDDDNNESSKSEEIINGNEAVNKIKTKEKENKSENEEELKINNNCEDIELKKIVEKALLSTKLDNLEAARNIENNSAIKFGGRFNSIVSNNEFAYVNWYGKRNCQLKVGGRHSLTWED